jgi:DNA mismatch repair protein MutH
VVHRKGTKKVKAHDELVAKERLVLSMINYNDVVNETFETSSLMNKIENMLVISYVSEDDVDPLDYPFAAAELWHIPEEDLPTIRNDWNIIVEKVRAGKAHEISGSDTTYLEACTKGSAKYRFRPQPYSDEPAKSRAWAFKNSYMTGVLNSMIDGHQKIRLLEGERELPLSELIRKRFEPYHGLDSMAIAHRLGMSVGEKLPKNFGAMVTKRILGVDEDSMIVEFEKANIKPKTIRLTKTGRPKEAISTPVFSYFDVSSQPFEDSDFYEIVNQKYLFVVYEEDDEGVYRLADVLLWQMPESDVDEAKACYEEMQRRINDGNADWSVRSSENRCCHVRPHGINKMDTLPTPYGPPETKKCFWFNQDYLKDEIARLRSQR